MVTAEPFEPGAAALAEAKAHARIDNAAEDALMAGLVRASAELCEQFVRRALVARQHVELLPAIRGWQRLAAAPVQAILSIEGLPREGSGFPISAGDRWSDIDAAGEGWVRAAAPAGAARLRVTYIAGIAADWAALPPGLKHGIVRLATHLYVHRDADQGSDPPAAVAALWRPWRRLRLS